MGNTKVVIRATFYGFDCKCPQKDQNYNDKNSKEPLVTF
jgi:hypothetical protein